MNELSYSALNFFYAILPLAILLCCLLKFKQGATYSGIYAFVVAFFIGWIVFGGRCPLLLFASLKGLNLSLYLALIIWPAVLLFNIVQDAGGFKFITEYLELHASAKTLLCLLTAWCFSGMLQGIAGFGVPVAIIVPFVIAMGFSSAIAVAATLIGHAWSITFGSMAASFYMLQLVTQLESFKLALWLGLLFIAPTILTGFAVVHICLDFEAIKGNWKFIIFVGMLMSLTMLSTATMGMPQLASFFAGMSGVLITLLALRLTKTDYKKMQTADYKKVLESMFPYLILVLLIVISVLDPIKSALESYQFALSYPAVSTSYGFIVAEESNYAAIKYFSHPGPLIMITILITYLYYSIKGNWPKGFFKKNFKKTYRQCATPTLAIVPILMMAITMNDTGMTTLLANGLARMGQQAYQLMSPFIGVLGCFMTGTNVNSNVLFGSLQVKTADSLGLNNYLIASLQSIGGSLGSSISPAKVLLGATVAGLSGSEYLVFRKVFPYCLGIVSIVGIIAWFISTLIGINSAVLNWGILNN